MVVKALQIWVTKALCVCSLKSLIVSEFEKDHCRITQSNSCTCKILFWSLQYRLRDPDCHFGYLWWFIIDEPVLVVCALLIDRLSHSSRPCRAHVITGHSMSTRRSPLSLNASSSMSRRSSNAVPSGDAWATGNGWSLESSSSHLVLAFTFTILSTSTTSCATPPIATSPIVTPKRTISTGKSSVSEGVVKLKLKTSFAKRGSNRV